MTTTRPSPTEPPAGLVEALRTPTPDQREWLESFAAALPVGYRTAVERTMRWITVPMAARPAAQERRVGIDLLHRAVFKRGIGEPPSTGPLDYPTRLDGTPSFANPVVTALRGLWLNPLGPESWIVPSSAEILVPILGLIDISHDPWKLHLRAPDEAPGDDVAIGALTVPEMVEVYDGLVDDWKLCELGSRRWDRFDFDPSAGSLIALRLAYALTGFEANIASACKLSDSAPDDVDFDNIESYTDYGPVQDLLRDPGLCVARATPYFIPAEMCEAVFDSDAPTDAVLEVLRLPFHHVLVGFGGPMTIPAPDDPDGVIEEAMRRPYLEGFGALESARQGEWRALDPAAERELSLSGVAALQGVVIEAIVLHADTQGRLADELIWCVGIHRGDDVPYARLCMAASLNKCDEPVQDVVRNLAGVVAAADWTDPPAQRPGNRNELRKAVRRGAEASGHLGGVRVLTTKRSTSSETVEPTGRRMRPHERRGHLRGARVGPRASWELHRSIRLKWIPPTVVNADLGPVARDTVRRPPTAGETAEPTDAAAPSDDNDPAES